jgi:hypothetical protein
MYFLFHLITKNSDCGRNQQTVQYYERNERMS